MQLNDLRVNLTLDNNGFRLSVADSTRMLRQFEQRLGGTANSLRQTEGALSGFGDRAHRMIQTLGLARFALMDLNDIFLAFPKAVMGSAGEIERLTKLMEGLSTKTTEAGKKMEAAANVKFVFNMAKSAPFEVKALTDTFVKLKTGGVDPLDGSMNSLVDSVAKFGGTSEQLHRASIAIQQMGGKGVISMEELRQQLGEAVPTAMQAMAIGMGMSMSELTQAVSKGTVASGMAMKKMFAIMMVDNAGAAHEMMSTWTGMLERLKTEWEMWKLGVAGEGFGESMKSGLGELINMLKSPEAESFGRSLGRTMNDGAIAVLDFAKTVRSMWSEIKVAGEILLYYFAGSKLMPLLAGGSEALTKYYRTITGGIANVTAAQELELAGRRAEMLERAALMEQTIANNLAEIASNQARANAARAARAQELSEMIAQNQAILGVYAARATAANAAMTAASPANSSAVRAVQNGTATAAQDLEAQVLLRHADAARIDSAEIATRTAALQAQNAAMTTERTLLVTTDAALTADSAARQLSNGHLQTAGDRYRGLANNMTQTSSAMAMMGAAARTVGTAISAMVFSLGGLMTAIMAAAWAWNHFSEKAQEAAKNAKLALEAKDRVAQGRGNADDQDASQKGIDELRTQLENAKRTVHDIGDLTKYGRDNAEPKERLRKAKELVKNLPGQIAEAIANAAAENKQVVAKAGENAGRAIAEEFQNGVNKQLASANVNVAKITDKYAALKIAQGGKLTDQQTKDQNIEQKKARYDELLTSRAAYDKKIDEYSKEAEKSQQRLAGSGLEGEALTQAQKELSKNTAAVQALKDKRAEINNGIVNLDAANDMIDPKKKDKKHSVMDSVLTAINSERKKVDQANTNFDKLLEDALDVKQLQADYRKEIETLNENDKDKQVTKKHSSADEDRLVDLKTQSAVMERIKAIYGGLAKQRKDIEEDYLLSVQKMEGGNFQLEKKGPVQRVVDRLESELIQAESRLKKIPGEVERIKKALDDARAVMSMEAYNTGTKLFGENQKENEANSVALIKNDRSRLAAQQALETKALQQKYMGQLEAVRNNREMTLEITRQYNEAELNMAKMHVEQMKTPLDKLAESWADSTEAMRKSSESWANQTMDFFVKIATTGKFEFRSLVTSILSDIARIEMQKAAGGFVTKLISTGVSLLTGGTSLPQSSLPGAPVVPINPMPGFANGGIMSNIGSLPLHKYATGGIASTPQLAVFGEGRMREAYVPLPDGRSIPVTMKGAGGSGGNQVNIGITVNAQTGQESVSGGGAGDMGKLAQRLKQAVQTTIAEEMRPGGLLYK